MYLKQLKIWGPILAWALLIFTMSAKSTASTSEVYWQDFVIKKLAHIIEYFIFANLLYRSLRLSKVSQPKIFYITFIISVLYAITDEVHQSFTPGREPRARDVGFDTIGVSCALIWIKYLLPALPKKLRPLAKKLEMI